MAGSEWHRNCCAAGLRRGGDGTRGYLALLASSRSPWARRRVHCRFCLRPWRAPPMKSGRVAAESDPSRSFQRQDEGLTTSGAGESILSQSKSERPGTVGPRDRPWPWHENQLQNIISGELGGISPSVRCWAAVVSRLVAGQAGCAECASKPVILSWQDRRRQ